MPMRHVGLWLLVVGCGIAAMGQAQAQSTTAFSPAQGQGEAQQSRDRSACHDEAVEQTGSDPSLRQAPTTSSDTAGGGAFGRIAGKVAIGTATGAAVGAATGAVSGNADKGAFSGAVAGGAHGAVTGGVAELHKATQQAASTPSPSQGATQKVQPSQEYQRIYTLCMEARGYRRQ